MNLLSLRVLPNLPVLLTFPALLGVLLTFPVLPGSPPSLRAAAADDKPPAPKLPLGRETTYVTGPLDVEGYIDYMSALNAELSRGVTPQTNANVLLIQAFGPAPEGGNGLPPAYFKWLGIPIPSRDGDRYMVSIGGFARDKLALRDEQIEAVYDQQSRCTRRPWTAREYPVVAEWLKANEIPLGLVVEATGRPRYFNPLVTQTSDGKRGLLINALLPSVQRSREVANALTARAMLRVGEGRFNDAWADLIACHRLARLLSQGGTMIEGLVAVAIHAIATNSTLAYLEAVKLDSPQLARRLKELQALPGFKPLSDLIELGERFMGLDSFQHIRSGGFVEGLGLSPDDVAREATAEKLKALDSIDWAPGLKAINRWYDKLVAATRLPDRADRQKAFAELEKELLARKKDRANPVRLGWLLLNPLKPIKGVISEEIAGVMIELLTPAIARIQGAYDRASQLESNLHLAFALAAYRADTGKYPTKLADLAPKYLPVVPSDIFTGQPLVYKPTEAGYLLYSVGQNGKDDGGTGPDDDPPGDDLVVRMPLPPLRKR